MGWLLPLLIEAPAEAILIANQQGPIRYWNAEAT